MHWQPRVLNCLTTTEIILLRLPLGPQTTSLKTFHGLPWVVTGRLAHRYSDKTFFDC